MIIFIHRHHSSWFKLKINKISFVRFLQRKTREAKRKCKEIVKGFLIDLDGLANYHSAWLLLEKSFVLPIETLKCAFCDVAYCFAQFGCRLPSNLLWHCTIANKIWFSNFFWKNSSWTQRKKLIFETKRFKLKKTRAWRVEGMCQSNHDMYIL